MSATRRFAPIGRLPLLHRLRQTLAIALLFCAGLGPALAAESLMIAVGAGYKRPIGELAAAFERRSGIRLEPLFGNMGQVLAQAGQSDRVALVLGDQAFLEEAGQVAFSRYLPVGRGRLVLAWPNGKRLAEPADLAAPGFARIALPDPRHAVYGKAASQFLARSALAPRLQGRLLTVATVPQVSAYLTSGEVDAGFVNLTEALALSGRIGGYRELDPGLYDPIRIVAGVIRGRENRPGVAELAAFLETPEARAALARHGL